GRFTLRNGLPLLVGGWGLLLLARGRRRGVDRVEALMFASFLWIGLTTQRFVGFLALAGAPYLARDLEEWLGRLRVRPVPVALRAALIGALCVVGSIPEWRRVEHPLGLALDLSEPPAAACAFIAAHELRGRGFNPFHFGGYQLWRFWPNPARLPFMDIHQTGTPMLRAFAAA